MRMDNINDSFFDGQYKDIWRAIIPAELTVKEIDFMLSYFNLDKDSHVLDLMCGYGRHSLALGRKGIQATAVDNLPDYINEIKDTVQKENLPVTAIAQGVLDFQSNEQFDLVLCMGNSLNFFNAKDTQKVLANVASLLKPGGHVLINTWSLAEIVIKNFVAKGWSEIAGFKYLTASEFLFHPTRVEAVSTIISPEGKIETKKSVDYIFSVSEMDTMLEQAGLKLKEIYSIPGRKKFTVGEPRAYIVAQKA